MDAQQERFSRAYDAYGALLYRVCVTHIGRDDAEDVLQDVFIRYLRHEKPFADAEHERRWLIRVCVNLCNSRRGWVKRRAEDELTPETAPCPDGHGETEVLDAVRRLPAKLKSVVVLHCCEGYTLEETAKLLGVGLSAVKMRLARAREKLKLELDL